MLLQVCIYCVNSASHFLVICIESLTVGTHTQRASQIVSSVCKVCVDMCMHCISVCILLMFSLCVCLSMYYSVQRLKTTTIRDSSGYKCSATDSHVLAVRVSFSPSPSSPHSLPLLGKCFPLTVPLWVASITTLHISPLTDFPSEGRKLSWLAHSSSDRTVRVFATVYAGYVCRVFVLCVWCVCVGISAVM